MASCKLSPKTSLLALRPHVAFTLRKVKANPLTQSLVPIYTSLLEEWPVIQAAELDLLDQIDEAQVGVITVDIALNAFAKRVSKETLLITGDNREDILYVHLFHGKPLHTFIRPILGAQLAAMRAWGPTLEGSGQPSLKALADELPALIALCDGAAKAKADAVAKYSDFRDVGDRHKYCDKLNAARKESHGFLATLPYKHLGLPSNFADLFFRRVRAAIEDEEPTIDSVEETITGLHGELAEQEELLATLKDAAKKAAEQAEMKKAKKAELEVIEKEMAEKQKKADALRAELL